MTKDEIKALVKQVIEDMSNEYGIATEIDAVGNTTANIAGYDAPLGAKLKRKLKDFEFTDEDKDN